MYSKSTIFVSLMYDTVKKIEITMPTMLIKMTAKKGKPVPKTQQGASNFVIRQIA
jgi:hypothetical protein